MNTSFVDDVNHTRQFVFGTIQAAVKALMIEFWVLNTTSIIKTRLFLSFPCYWHYDEWHGLNIE
jgi:hypothetical protein